MLLPQNSTDFCRFFPALLTALIITGCCQKKQISATAQPLRTEIENLAKAIETDNYIGTRYMARIQTESEAWSKRQKLMKDAEVAELHHLMDYPNTVVMLTAFEGLHRKKDQRVSALFNAMLDNNEKVGYIKGDIYTSMPALEYAYVYVLGYAIPGESAPYLDVPIEHWVLLSIEEQSIAEEKIKAYRNLRE